MLYAGQQKTFVWTRVTVALGNGGPLGMLSIPKPIKIKVPLHQSSLLLFNLHYMFHFTVFLPDRGIAALPHFFGKCRTIFSPRGPKGAKKENKKTTTTTTTTRCGKFLSGMLFTLHESFASLSLFKFARIACLLQL